MRQIASVSVFLVLVVSVFVFLVVSVFVFVFLAVSVSVFLCLVVSVFVMNPSHWDSLVGPVQWLYTVCTVYHAYMHIHAYMQVFVSASICI